MMSDPYRHHYLTLAFRLRVLAFLKKKKSLDKLKDILMAGGYNDG